MKKQKKLKKVIDFIKKTINFNDFFIILYIISNILLMGLLINVSLIFLGVPFNILEILSFGSLYWFVINKIFPELRKLWFRK